MVTTLVWMLYRVLATPLSFWTGMSKVKAGSTDRQQTKAMWRWGKGGGEANDWKDES